MATAGKKTPLMEQYDRIKAKHVGAILLFRMGDFYETFGEDAVRVADLLGITLTKRGNGDAKDVPLAGFPHHALDAYLPRLVRAGHRVAICEQLEEPSPGKKIVDRGVVEIVSPGVALHDPLLEPKVSNYLATLVREGGEVGIALLEATTGRFLAGTVPVAIYEDVLSAYPIREVIIARADKNRFNFGDRSLSIQVVDDWIFQLAYAQERLTQHFETFSLEGFGLAKQPLSVIAAGAAFHYLNEAQGGRTHQLHGIQPLDYGETMLLDEATKRNLEISDSIQRGDQEGTLVAVLDKTVTPGGARLLRDRLMRPLKSLPQISSRLGRVEALFEDDIARHAIRDTLATCSDLHRIAARIRTERATPRDLWSLHDTCLAAPDIIAALEASGQVVLSTLAGEIPQNQVLISLIADKLDPDADRLGKEGPIIKKGSDERLDYLRGLIGNAKSWLSAYQAKEATETGISSLKVSYNRVFGYYIEVTNTHRQRVPAHYVRKQTLANSERYITDDLKRVEEEILGADAEIEQLERQLFASLIASLLPNLDAVLVLANILDDLDVSCSLAQCAVTYNYVKPHLVDEATLEIIEGRHPVVERMLPVDEPFIANDVSVSRRSDTIMIITGPNMAGKSVILRQTGLIVLLAQIGSFVPATKATIGIVDRIFTRVGASDNLAAGESTFLVEMHETARILHAATSQSLVLLDEVGRGTATYDGLAIARALVEFLHNEDRLRPRTLFATHYHELNVLEKELPFVVNYRVEAKEYRNKLVFLRKLVRGSGDHSLGIAVARMAGLPDSLIRNAKKYLQTYMSQATAGHGNQHQIPIFDQQPEALTEAVDDVDELRQRLRQVDVDDITPREALTLLYEFHRLSQDKPLH